MDYNPLVNRPEIDNLTTEAEEAFRTDNYKLCREVAWRAFVLSSGDDPSLPAYPLGMVKSLAYLGASQVLGEFGSNTLGMLKHAVSILDQNDDPELRSFVYTGLGFIYLYNGDTHTARSYTQRAIAISEAGKFEFYLADALITHSSVMITLGDYEDAQPMLERASKIARKLRNARLEAACHTNMVYIYMKQGNIRMAENSAKTALALSKNDSRLASILDTLGVLARQAGNLAQAADYFRQANAALGVEGNDMIRAELGMNLGEVLFELGKIDEAESLLKAALALADQGRINRASMQCHLVLANLYEKANRPQDAYHHLKQHNILKDATNPGESMGRLMDQMIAHKLARQLPQGGGFGNRHNQQENNEELAYLAATDPLTGLLTGRQLGEVAKSCIGASVAAGQPCCVLLFKLAELEQINETHGELAGDRALVALAELAIQSVRVGDQCARVGTDAIAILLPKTSVVASERIAQRIKRQLGSVTIRTDTDRINVGVKVGIAAIQPGDDDLQAALTRAANTLK